MRTFNVTWTFYCGCTQHLLMIKTI